MAGPGSVSRGPATRLLFWAFLPGSPGGKGLQLLCLATGLLHLYRLAHWQGWKTRAVPLLWSLRLSYLCIPLAWRSSSVLWIFAFSCFLYRYLPILTRPRADGKPG